MDVSYQYRHTSLWTTKGWKLRRIACSRINTASDRTKWNIWSMNSGWTMKFWTEWIVNYWIIEYFRSSTLISPFNSNVLLYLFYRYFLKFLHLLVRFLVSHIIKFCLLLLCFLFYRNSKSLVCGRTFLPLCEFCQ